MKPDYLNCYEVIRIKRQFTEHYEMKDLGELNYYLGMKITGSEENIKLDQSGCVREILEMCLVGKHSASYHEIGI